MHKNFLLTYKIVGAGYDFEWFDTEEELLARVEFLGNNIEEIDGIQLQVIKQVIDE